MSGHRTVHWIMAMINIQNPVSLTLPVYHNPFLSPKLKKHHGKEDIKSNQNV